MSLLIKALKKAERRHDAVRQSSELPPVPASIAAARPADPPPDATLEAVNSASPELQLEIAEFADRTSSETLSSNSGAASTITMAPLAHADPVQETASPHGDDTSASTGRGQAGSYSQATGIHLEMAVERQSTEPLPARASDAAIATGTAPIAGRTAAFAAAAGRASSTSTKARMTPPAASAAASSWRSRLRLRPVVYAALALLTAFCLSWLAIEFFGVAPWRKPPAVAVAPTNVLLPVPPAAGETATAADHQNNQTEGAASSSSAESSQDRGTAKSRSAASRTARTAGARNAPSALANPTAAGADAAEERRLALAPGQSVDSRSEPVLAPQTGIPSGIRLSRDDSSAQQVLQLNERAWAALSRNDLLPARQAYEASLRLDRNNLDAWLGLASLAARAGDIAAAEQHYRRALDIDPNDSAARAGLLSLTAQQDPRTAESRLRGLIDREGAQPPMMFALGNTLAAQQRWVDAQAAYFAAFSGDPANADYAFNLAISLERMRQPAMAAGFYRKSLELADKRPGRFARSQAERRLAAIEAASEAPAKNEQPRGSAGKNEETGE